MKMNRLKSFIHNLKKKAMQVFEFDMEIPASSIEEATRKATAGAALIKELSIAELEKLAYIVKHDPDKRAMARRFLGV